jgi:hypothetical protein
MMGVCLSYCSLIWKIRQKIVYAGSLVRMKKQPQERSMTSRQSQAGRRSMVFGMAGSGQPLILSQHDADRYKKIIPCSCFLEGGINLLLHKY